MQSQEMAATYFYFIDHFFFFVGLRTHNVRKDESIILWQTNSKSNIEEMFKVKKNTLVGAMCVNRHLYITLLCFYFPKHLFFYLHQTTRRSCFFSTNNNKSSPNVLQRRVIRGSDFTVYSFSPIWKSQASC
jgi:hypothetical protein